MADSVLNRFKMISGSRFCFIFSLMLLCRTVCSYGQDGYTRVEHFSGTITRNGVATIAIPTGSTSPAIINPNMNCGNFTYWICRGLLPGSYEFEFLTPVKRVRIVAISLNDSEVVSISVNHQAYELQADEVTMPSLPCSQNPAILWNGNLAVFTGNPGSTCSTCPVLAAAGEINISGEISSVKIDQSKGKILGGTEYNIYYREFIMGANKPCEGDSLKLRTLPVHYDNSANYLWTGPAGFTSIQRDPAIANAGPQNEGVYILRIVTATDTVIDSMQVVVKPVPDPVISYDNPLCEGRDLVLSPGIANAPDSGAAYIWFGPKDFYSRDSMPVIKNARSDRMGVYRLRAILDGCVGETEREIDMMYSDTTQIVQKICRGDRFYFNGQYLGEPGVFLDTLTNAHGCDSIIALTLDFMPVYTVETGLEPASGYCQGDTVEGFSVDQSEYLWYVNNTFLGTAENMRIPLRGRVNELLAVHTSDDGCKDSLKTFIPAEVCCDVFIPDAFTPNGDGLNDYFGIVSHGHLSKLDIMVVDRWGRTVYKSNALHARWDGRYEGAPAPVGTYYYYYTGNCMDGRSIKKSGDVTLVR